MRFAFQYLSSAELVEFQYLLGVAVECCLAGIFLPTIVVPDTPVPAVGWYTAFG
jgi:hypothetical protein